MKCLNCGKEIQDDSNFCNYCGSSNIEKNLKTNHIVKLAKKCADCNNKIPPDSKFCPYCGSENLVDYEIKEKQIIIKECGNCNKQLPPDSNFCQYCGSNDVVEKIFNVSSLNNNKTVASNQNVQSYQNISKIKEKRINEGIVEFLKKKWKIILICVCILLVLFPFGFKYYAKNIAISNQKVNYSFYLCQDDYYISDDYKVIRLKVNKSHDISWKVYGLGVTCEYSYNSDEHLGTNDSFRKFVIKRKDNGFALIVFENEITHKKIKVYVGD